MIGDMAPANASLADRLCTRANALTASRLLSAPLLALAIARDATLLAFGLFLLAIATDLLDGRVARRRGEASTLGGVLDHATDATFVTIGLASIASIGRITPLLPALVALSFVQYLVDSRAHRGRALRASRLGRWNGIAYYVVLGVPVVRDALGLAWPGDALAAALAWALVASTLVSMLDRALAPRV